MAVGHRVTEVAGSFIYGVYFFCGPMILINLLIAIMSASFQSVTGNSDTEWKFARVQVGPTVFMLDDTWTRANFHSVSEFPVTLWNEADMMAMRRLMRIIGPQKK